MTPRHQHKPTTAASAAHPEKAHHDPLSASQLVHDENLPWPLNCFQGLSTNRAKIHSALGCLSSCLVLAVRLYLDNKSTTYLIHSIIVWTDMVLIHLFTKSVWLSVCGEITTYVFFLSYHFTHEVVFELLETTILAMLCSFHMIGSRHEIGQERDMLEDDIESLRRKGAILLRNIDQINQQLKKKESESVLHRAFQASDQEQIQPPGHGESVPFGDMEDDTTKTASDSSIVENTELTRELLQKGECNCSLATFSTRLMDWLTPFNDSECTLERRLRCYSDIFFEYFLDGAAGVMYTSFLGLIIDASMKWGDKDPY